MKSPFPGMDPYLERRWSDVHQRLCTYACDQLNAQLKKGLVARLGERLIVESEEQTMAIYPDVRVVKHRDFGEGSQAVAVLEDVAEPVKVRIEHEPERQAYIDITEVDSGKLITGIEFLSVSNKKPGPGRRLYKKKQKALHAARVNLVEIDLLRSGRSVFVLPRDEFPESADAPYFATIIRGRRPDIIELYPISLRQPLPSLRIPLRPQDADVALRLQPIFEQAYKNGRYEDTKYRRRCVPPIEPEDARWADELLRSLGKR